ncbi:MAG: GtrA family protein [Sulfolobaceae archaeon]|jgi:Predicted membrane protein|nr:GtrA family protein [Sulfolobales archaeon]
MPRVDILRRLVLYSLVGTSGTVVNEVAFAALQKAFALVIAVLVALELSILWNFALNDSITFNDRRGSPFLARLLKFHSASAAGSVIQVMTTLVLFALYKGDPVNLVEVVGEVAGLPYFTAALLNLPGIILGFVIRFAMSYLWVWNRRA